MSGYQIPRDDSWSFVVQQYPRQLWDTVFDNLTFMATKYGLLSIPLYLTIIAALVCIGIVALSRSGGEDPLAIVVRGAILGCVLLLLLLLANNPQGYRLELIFVPVVAVGAATALERCFGRKAEVLSLRS